MNTILHKIFILVIISSLTNVIRAQVTIGSDTKANTGTILDIKQYDDATATDGGRNADKGLIMPRVQLNRLDNLQDVNLPPSSNESHIGLVVYNTNECLDYGINDTRGIYVWDGNKWTRIGKPTRAPYVYEYIDRRDPANPQTYLYRKFGNAGIWMLENMRAIKYMQGGSDVEAGIISSTGAPFDLKRYVYPGRTGTGTDSQYFDMLPAIGLLYSWAAATNNENLPDDLRAEQEQIAGETPGNDEVEKVMPNGWVQGICPDGWHVPSDREWNVLEKEISTYPWKYSTNTGTTWESGWETTENHRGSHGNSMKTSCLPPGMTSPFAQGNSFSASQGGFNIYLTGFASASSGALSGYGSGVFIRSSSSGANSSGAKNAWHRSMANSAVGVYRVSSYRNNLMSVRCKKNNDIP